MPYPVAKALPYLLEKEKCALLVIDMQNDFVRLGGRQEVPDTRKTIPVQRKLMDYFRLNGLPVVYTKFLAGPQYSLLWEWSPMCGPEEKSCWKGVMKKYHDREQLLDGSDIIDELYPLPGDPIIEKYGYSAFHHTLLEDWLRYNGVEYIVATGTVTQICVEDTVRGAFHRQFRCVVAEDAVSSFSDTLQQASLEGISMKYGRVETSERIIEELDVR